jgi:hypothetical protein
VTRRQSVVLAVVLLASYAYFYQAGGWNQNSRFDLVRAISERGSVRIVDYDQITGDKAVFDGHVYSDKAPGQALTAVPAVAVARLFGAGFDDNSIALLAYLATVCAAGLPTVAAALCLLQTARRLGATPGGAAFAAVAYGLSTPAWVYATLLWGNALAAGCLMAAFLAAVALRTPADAARDRRLALAVGAASGWAVVAEYPAAPAGCILAALALVHAGSRRFRQVLGWVVLGALVPALILAVYNATAFGSPVHISYQNVEGFSGMQEGVLGLTTPKRTVLQELLFGSFRGLLPLAPVLVAAPLGLVLLWRRCSAARASIVATVGIVTYYLLLNASYYYWDGGFSFGPRLVGAALPFMCFGLAEVFSRARRLVGGLLALVTAYGVAITAMAISTIVMLPEDAQAPVAQLIWPAFLSGNLALNHQTFIAFAGENPAPLLRAWNIGQLLGFSGVLSLLPLGLAWLLAALAWISWRRQEDDASHVLGLQDGAARVRLDDAGHAVVPGVDE